LRLDGQRGGDESLRLASNLTPEKLRKLESGRGGKRKRGKKKKGSNGSSIKQSPDTASYFSSLIGHMFLLGKKRKRKKGKGKKRGKGSRR